MLRWIAFPVLCAAIVLAAWWGPARWTLILWVPLLVVALYDAGQRRHTLRRNYPLIAHIRWLFEALRPFLYAYVVESPFDGRPFTRSERDIVYARAKGDLDAHPFGTELDVYSDEYEWMSHSIAPVVAADRTQRVRVGTAQCSRPYDAALLNISAMSFGSLGAKAIEALNLGARRGGFYHDTGEGGFSPYHRIHGGDIVWELGSGYFGCRDATGRFDPGRFRDRAQDDQVRMIEIKLSQGAKPGHGGVLPGAKVSAEIAATRGVPEGEDCISPAAHSAFATPIEMVEWAARLRELSGGKPVGIKLCVGQPHEIYAVMKAMLETGIRLDFIVVDGAEGGTGAAPLEFTDHVGTPLQDGLQLVHNTLVGLNLRERIKIGCAGKVIGAFDIARAMALGADWCNSARGFMFALGCIQAQACHTGACPTGVTTQDPLRQRALEVTSKSERVYRFHEHTLAALKELTQAAGLTHPREFRPTHIVRRVSKSEVRLLGSLLPILAPGALTAAIEGRADWPHNVYRLYWPLAAADSFAATGPVAVAPSR